MKIYVPFWIFTALLFIGLHTSSGARGGGSRGGSSRSGSFRSSGSSRSSSTSRSSVRFGTRSSYGGPRYSSGSWKTAAAVGTLWGISSYQRRRLYSSYPDREPTICFNEDNLRNGTYGYFICPEDGQPDDYDSCCGDEDSQECCSFALTPGAIAGIVISVLIICAVIGIVVFCIVRRKGLCNRFKGGTVLSGSSAGGQQIIHTTPPQLYTVPPAGPEAYSYTPPENKYDSLTHYSKEPEYPPPPIGFTGSKAPLPTSGSAYDNAAQPYSTNGAPPYPTGGFTQPTGPYNTPSAPSVDPPPYSAYNQNP